MPAASAPPSTNLQGLMAAVQGMSRLGVPIYITETGVADVKDERRALMIDTYFKQVAAGGGSEGRDA